jgi:hypothetical protein
MAKSSEKPADKPEGSAPQTPPASGQQAPAQQADQQRQQQVQVEVDDSNAISLYANFCRVTGTPEELIVDFALNPQPMGAPMKAISVKQRIIVNYYTAKRMLAALQMSVQRHEAVFGVLETDIQKRLRPQATGPAGARPPGGS